MSFNINELGLVSEDYFIALAKDFFQFRLDLQYPPYQVLNITRAQLNAARGVNASENKNAVVDIQMLFSGMLYRNDVDKSTYISILRHGLAIYMIGLVLDFMNGGTKYTTENPTISLATMQEYTALITEVKTSLNISDYKIHNTTTKLSPSVRLSKQKQNNTATWWD